MPPSEEMGIELSSQLNDGIRAYRATCQDLKEILDVPWLPGFEWFRVYAFG